MTALTYIGRLYFLISVYEDDELMRTERIKCSQRMNSRWQV